MSIYKDCDIRGIYGKEFDEAQAYLIGRAVGTQHTGQTLAVGGDVRLSTPVLKEKITAGLRESGADVIDIGMLPTPVFYYALKTLPVSGGVMVTASHNPAQYNGFKLMFGDEPVTTETITGIEDVVRAGRFAEGKGKIARQDVVTPYRAWITGALPKGHIRVVLDCGNGTMSELAPAVMKELGYDVVPLFCSFDGSFPNRDPNPAVYSHLGALQEKTVSSGAAFGAAFDGDGDRVVFVDDLGRVAQSERALVVLIREYLKDKPSSVVYDLKSSSIVRDAVLALHGEPRMERSGHAFIKANFLKNHSALAGEISGHFFFGELGYDDGLYATAKMAEIIERSGKALSALVDEIKKTLITPDIRVFCPYAQRDGWLEKVREMGKEFEVSLIDGVRVDFPDGWLLVRKSVTEEGMTIRIEADNEAAMARIKGILVRTLPEVKEKVMV